MNVPRKHLIALLALVAALVFASGVAQSRLVVAQQSDVITLDPHAAGTTPDTIPLVQIAESLVTMDANGAVVPMLASEWTIADDGVTYVFTLRDGITFHDGRSMGAADVKYSLERFVEISPRGGQLPIEQVNVIDDLTVEVVLASQTATFLTALATSPPVSIVPEGLAEEQGGTITEPVGTGPFRFVSWEPDVAVRLARFEDYQPVDLPASGMAGRKVAEVDELVIRPIPEPSTRVTALRTGEVDIALAIPPLMADSVRNAPETEIVETPTSSWGIIKLGLKEGQMTDPLMRQALFHAIDRIELTEASLWGIGEPATSIIRPDSVWFNDDHAYEPGHDPERARELLAEAGYAGEEITIMSSTAFEFTERMSIVLQQQLEDVGIDATVQFNEWSTGTDIWFAGDYEVFVTHIGGRPDPDLNFYSYLYSTQTLNGYDSPVMDDLLDRARRELDFETRRDLYGQAHRLMVQDVPLIPIYFIPEVDGVSATLEGYSRNPVTSPVFWNVTPNR